MNNIFKTSECRGGTCGTACNGIIIVFYPAKLPDKLNSVFNTAKSFCNRNNSLKSNLVPNR